MLPFLRILDTNQSSLDLALHTRRAGLAVTRSTLNNLQTLSFPFSQLNKFLGFVQNRLARCFLEDFLVLFFKMDRLTSGRPSVGSRRNSVFREIHLNAYMYFTKAVLPCLVLRPSHASFLDCSCLRYV